MIRRRTRTPTFRTVMDDAVYILASWFSPAYPVGAFSYSHGLERAVADGVVSDRATLAEWGADCLAHGAGRSDAILLAAAYRAPDDDEIADLAVALAPSAERRLETAAQGAAFAATTGAVWGLDLAPAAYPVAVGRAAAALELPLGLAALCFLHAFVSNSVSAGVRLIPLGQTDGQRVIEELRPLCRRIADEALAADLDDLGGCAFQADIASMRHETQDVRLFRS